MKGKKLVLSIIAIIALVILNTSSVFAANDNLIVIGSPTTNTANTVANTANNVVNSVSNNVVNNTANNTANSINNTAKNNTSVYNNTSTLPKTGDDNFTVFFIIAICGISAIYAYKKIRDYNV